VEARSSTRKVARERTSLVTRLGGTTGNERLTAMTAAVLLVLLAVEGVTVLFMGPLLSTHIFVGMLLVPPVALKLATTGYRFARYYTGNRAYRQKGAPTLLMRVLAPGVVASTLGLFASGVALAALGPGTRFVLPLHKASFIVWLVTMSAHVLGHVLKLPRLISADWRPRERAPGSWLRATVVAGALVAGAIVALATLPLIHPWVHWAGSFHGDG
jgi:hypothetical protein